MSKLLRTGKGKPRAYALHFRCHLARYGCSATHTVTVTEGQPRPVPRDWGGPVDFNWRTPPWVREQVRQWNEETR